MSFIEIIEKIISIVFSLLIFANAYLFKKIVGNWYNPSSLYSLFWFIFTFFPLVFLYSIPLNSLSLFYILISCVFFSISTLGFDWNKVKRSKNVNFITFNNRFLRNVFYVIMFLTFSFQIINFYVNGFSFTNIIFNFMESSSEYTNMRYSDDIKENYFSKLSYVLCYLGVALGGLLYSQKNKNKLIILVLTFFPPLFIMLTQSAKGSFFLALFIFYGGIVVNKIFTNDLELFNRKTMTYALKIILIILPFVILSFLTRVFSDDNDIELLIAHMKLSLGSYSCGHLYAFSDWFTFYIGKNSLYYYREEDISYGFYTFMSIFRFFGSTKMVPMGTYDEYYYYKELLQTNIYTSYRGLVQDFTIIGSLIYLLIKGFILNVIFYNILRRKYLTLSISFFVFMIGDFYHSFMISILNSNSIYLSFFLLVIILKINNIKLKY